MTDSRLFLLVYLQVVEFAMCNDLCKAVSSHININFMAGKTQGVLHGKKQRLGLALASLWPLCIPVVGQAR